MSHDIKRLAEKHIADALTAVLPGTKFIPFTGEGLNDTELEPPFCVVKIDQPEKMIGAEGTWLANGGLHVITHADETTSEDHSTLVRDVYHELSGIRPSVTAEFTLHGLDVKDIEERIDNEESCHLDVINFVCGLGG